MTYVADYASFNTRSSCHWVECEDKPIQHRQLRIGKGAKQPVWYHVDCFFKYLVALGPQNLKLQSWEDFRFDRDYDMKEEDKQLLDAKIKQCHKDKENKKRKAEEDINDRFAKIAKLDVPPLFTDNLVELLCKFDNKDLLTASLVNRQFNSIARRLLFTREVSVPNKKFFNTTEKQMPFVMQLKKLSFERSMDHRHHNGHYTRLLAQLTNLQSINFPGEALFVLPAIKTLTQLTSLHLNFYSYLRFDYSDNLSHLSFDAFKELTDLSLEEVPGTLNSEKLPIQLTSLTLCNVTIDSLRRFTNLEHLCLITNIDISINDTDNLLNTEAFELPRLTSLKVTCSMALDLSKWTRLKVLEHHENGSKVGKFSLPPNLEQFIAPFIRVYRLPDLLPSTMKYLSVGDFKEFFRSERIVQNFNRFMQAVDQRCHINLLCSEFMNIPKDIKKRPNLTLEISTSSYGNAAWSDMIKIFWGPLPERLHIHFNCWKNCRYKPKLLEQLQRLETKTRLLVDYRD